MRNKMPHPRPLPRIRIFGPLDLAIVSLIIALTILSIPALQAGTPSIITVKRDNVLVGRYPLTENRTIGLRGATGPVSLEISEGKVRLLHSTCKNQICVQTGSVSRCNQHIICAPNHLTIEITSNNAGSGIDAINR